MACKKPIVASNVGGMVDIIKTKNNGFLAEVANTKEFAEYIMKYIKDKELHYTVSNYNYKYAIDNFNIDKLINKHENIFNTL